MQFRVIHVHGVAADVAKKVDLAADKKRSEHNREDDDDGDRGDGQCVTCEPLIQGAK